MSRIFDQLRRAEQERALEKLAREQMHLVRPGEIIYTLPEKK